MPNETADWDKLAGELRKRADEEFPTSWQPEQPGDELIGFVRRVVMQAPTSYGPSPVVEIETPTGTRYSLWLFHKVLRQSFERERVKLNELVLVRYLGEKRPEGGGNAYANYRLIVDRAKSDAEPDWAGIADAYGDEAAAPVRGRRESPPPDEGQWDPGSDPEADDIPF